MNATDTRAKILEKNAEAIHINGFQGTRTDKVIAELGITKGAFYHYFPDKLAMGYAIIDEILYPQYISAFAHLENYSGNPVDGVVAGIERIRKTCDEKTVGYGCPLNNLIQEMSPLDEGFRKRLSRIVEKEIDLIAQAFVQAKANGQMAAHVEPQALANFVFAGLEGSFTVGKIKQSKQDFDASVDQLVQFLNTLKTG